MMTVAPPRWKRSAIALPTPFVPPVTRTRLSVNSFARELDVFISRFSWLFQREVVEENVLRNARTAFGHLHLFRLLCSVVSSHSATFPENSGCVQNIFTIGPITIGYRNGTATLAILCAGCRGAALQTRRGAS